MIPNAFDASSAAQSSITSINPQACGFQCPLEAEAIPITPAEASARFQCEAEQGFYDTGRYRADYFIWGKGPPLVLIPGLADKKNGRPSPP